MAGWDTVLTALVSSGATLTGVGLTHRYTFRRWQLERDDDRRVEQRDAAIELLDAATVWSRALSGLVLGVVAMKGDVIALSDDTKIADRYDEPGRAMGRAIARALLTITDDVVRAVVSELSTLYDGVGILVEDTAKSARERHTLQAKNDSEEYLKAVEGAIGALELASVQRFSNPRAPAQRRRWALRRHKGA